MFIGKKIYDYEGLYLDDEMVKKIKMQEASGIEMLSLLQQYDNIYVFQNSSPVSKLKEEMIQKFCSHEALKKNYCYCIRENRLMILPIDIYYGIFGDNQLITYYDSEEIQKVELSKVITYGIQTLTEDMGHQTGFTNKYNEQARLMKTYKSLTSL